MSRALLGFALISMTLAACSPGGLGASRDAVYAPGLDPRGQAVSGLEVGHRLMQAGEYDLALDAFTRAAAEEGMTAEVLTSLGSANLALGRLNQSEKLLRLAVKREPAWPEAWNNLGVVLIERGKTAEASEIFRKAYALDNGQSDSIRDNLRLALEKLDNPDYGDQADNAFKLVRRGSGVYQIRVNR
jgi:Flp pilus assembly protein TadD